MTASAKYARTVRVRGSFNQECSLFALTCDELPGLYLAGKDLRALQDDVPNVIRALYKLDCGLDVKVTEVNPAVEQLSAKPSKRRQFINLDREFVALPTTVHA